MASNLTQLYKKFYDEYSDRYGPNTCILLLVGKFYELYDYIDKETDLPRTSIKRAVSIMNIMLKEKPGNGPNGELGLWSGFPEQSLHKFSQVLTKDGWTVVVIDQVKDSHNTVIDRTVTRVLSPGTHTETASDERMTVAALTPKATSIIDLTTGEVISYECQAADEILHMFQVYCVKEVVYKGNPSYTFPGNAHKAPETYPSQITCEDFLRKVFNIKTLMPLRSYLNLTPAIEESLVILMRFCEDHHPCIQAASHSIYNPQAFMRVSNNILEQLNMISNKKSVLNLLERTHSAIGKRSLRERILRPITSAECLEIRWSQVGWFIESDDKTIPMNLRQLYDIPRLEFLISSGNPCSTSILHLFQSYSASLCLIKSLENSPLKASESLKSSFNTFYERFRNTFDETKAQRNQDEEPIGFLTKEAGPESYEIELKIKELYEGWKRILDDACKKLGISTGIFSIYKKPDGEIVMEAPRIVQKVLQESASKPNPVLEGMQVEIKKSGPCFLTCTEFYKFSEKLRLLSFCLNATHKKELLYACDKLILTDELIPWLGNIDSSFSLAQVAKEYKWCRPSIGPNLNIKQLRHPLLESFQNRTEYIKHDVELGSSVNGWLLYGVNASGKSSLMKATGIAVLLAQAGSYVPAEEMSINPYDAAFSRIWSQDNIWAGLSSFAVEVGELRDILNLATSKSLVLGDEVCSGTESSSATALVASTLEHLDSIKANFMFATHLHDLAKVPGLIRPSIAVFHLRVRREGDKLIYDRTLQPGSGSSMYGLEVAKAMGIPFSLIQRAYEIRHLIEGTTTIESAARSSWNSQIQRYICESCKNEVVSDLEVHHIKERCKGGDNSPRNLVVLCDRCHDEVHSGQLEVGTVQQTSEGPVRVIKIKKTLEKQKATAKTAKTKWTEEQIETIYSAIESLKGRPASRICSELQLNGITISQAALAKLIKEAQ